MLHILPAPQCTLEHGSKEKEQTLNNFVSFDTKFISTFLSLWLKLHVMVVFTAFNSRLLLSKNTKQTKLQQLKQTL